MPATSISRTRQQLINAAGANLNVLSAGQSLAAEDAAAINNYVDPTIAQLAMDGIIDVTADLAADEIPTEFFVPLGQCIAAAAASEFGRAGDQGLMGNKVLAEMTLRRLISARPTYGILAVNYF